MNKKFIQLFATILFLFLGFVAPAQNLFFKDVAEISIKKPLEKRVIKPFKYRTINLDTNQLKTFLSKVPHERVNLKQRLSSNSNIMTIPLPDGTTGRFRVWETDIMDPLLAAQFPNIKTYTGQGIDDKTATITMDLTELGFHAMILSPTTTSIFIDTYAQGTNTNYISYFKKDFLKTTTFIESQVLRNSAAARAASTTQTLSKQCIGTKLRAYRLAVACTGEYAVAATGLASPTVAQTLAAIVTTVNRVDGVYEKEIDIRLVLVASESSVVFTKASTDPFTGNSNANTLINESQTVIDNYIGDANYDMGHTFSTGGGGLSSLGVICQSGQKAQSITGSPSPVGDPYDIDYVSHEMGHSLGADHTFNSVLGSCSGNGSNTTNAEPGSGSTIMAYAGICGTDDLQPHSDPQFHALSLDEISTYTFNSTGNTCGTLTNTGNTPPVVNVGANYTIPASTPFVLTGSATDADGDALTYSWEQVDVGGTYGAWNAPVGNAPLFRSFAPVATPVRYFPKISDVINNTTTIGEILPSYSRTMHFRLTARDNKAGGGGVCFAENAITVNGTSGPFVVTYPTATGVSWNVGETRTITWNTASTNASPISCANVTIQLSIDGGNTYPYTILASTANTGTATITVPNYPTTTARIRVMALGNIFYDISNNNFTIVNSTPTFFFKNTDSVKVCAATSGSAKLVSTSILSYTTPITLSATGVPAGASVSYSINPVTPGDSSVVTLNNTNTLAAGIYNITISGVSGSITRTQIITFIVGSVATPTLTTPANQTIGQKLLPLFTWSSVVGATSYTLDISISNTFATLVQSIPNIAVNSFQLTSALADSTVYYWRVKATNSCGDGVYSPQFLFKTGLSNCATYSITANKTISATGTPTITSSIVVPTASGVTISDVNVVGLIGTHTYITDLTFTLKSPAATSVVLFDQICSDGNAYANFNINLDDQASITTFPCPPTGNLTVVPVNPLAAYNGQSSAGTWTLTVKDNYTGDGGKLTSWGLQICSLTAIPLNLVYIFTGNGNWDIPSNWVNSSVPPASVLTGSQIIIDPIVGGQCYLNIPYTLTPGSIITVKPNKNFVVPNNLTIQN